MTTTVVILLFSILLSAFFSGIEIAFVTGNKFKLEIDKTKPNLKGKLLSIVTKSPSRFIGTLLIGNNICLVIYGSMAAIILEPPLAQFFSQYLAQGSEVLDISVLLAQTILSTILILVSGEFIPKAIFSINPNRSLTLFLTPVSIIYFLLYPFVSFTIWLSNFILRKIFRVNLTEEEVNFERTDLNYYLRQISHSGSSNSDEEIENEVKILQNVLEFPSIRAKECMIPRTEIVGIEVSEPIEKLKARFIETGHSKIMVYRDTLDDIIGFTHSFDLFKKPQNIEQTLKTVLIAPETMLAKEVLTQFIQQRKSVAVVVDEYGGTSGILTVEDIIEEIFGEIEDEHDKVSLIEQKISESEYIFSGRQEIDYLNETYKLGLPEDEAYETLSGLIIHHNQDIPVQNEVIEIGQFKLTATHVSNTRIEKVHVYIKKE